MSVAQQPGITPFFDIAATAAHFHRVAGDLARIAARPKLDQRREDAGQRAIGPRHIGRLQGLRRLADTHKLLLIVDEVQTGMGRCGTMFAYQLS
ncbi:aminotransferase class III-fold pyridoxal phosphate-dependent enzyme, partial [Agrobacterium tumefaciens]|uniref:aminotransferase class III-fold pyridoxal phosphate-dependent enzyme n=1 Tax=Agrobacterium tumefaciens TaxID=358 RepID=UPI003BA2DE42